MTRKVIVQRRAEIELAEAADWYENRSAGLGSEFLSKFRETVVQIVDNPYQYQIVQDDVRRVQVGHFPYGILYFASDDEVVITSCIHGRRSPARWPRTKR